MHPDEFLQTGREELARLKAERAVVDQAISGLEQLIDLDAKHSRMPRRSTGLKDQIERVLREEGRPVHYKEVYRLLIQRGVHVPGRNPERNVGAHMSADLRFKAVGGGLWTLAE